MADIVLTGNPFLAGPLPAYDCLEFRFRPVDLIEDPGQLSRIFIRFTDTPSPAGVEFTLVDLTFTTGTGQNEINLNGDSMFKALTLQQLFQNNPNVFGSPNITISNTGNDTNFIADYPPGPPPATVMAEVDDLINNGSVGLLVTASGSPETVVQDFRMIWTLLCDGVPICEPKVARPTYIDGDVQDIPLNLSYLLRERVSTVLPSPTDGFLTVDMPEYTIAYSWAKASAECGTEISLAKTTQPLQVWNGATNMEDGGVDGYRRLIHVGDNEPNIKFLTHSPETQSVCLDTFDWLWINCNAREFVPPGTVNLYYVSVRFWNADNVLVLAQTQTINTEEGQYVIPVGPANLGNWISFLPNWSQIDRYDVRVIRLNHTAPIAVAYSELKTYKLTAVCDCDTDIYYLDNWGGLTRMPFKTVESIDVTDSGTEVCVGTRCGDRVTDREWIDNTPERTLTYQSCSLRSTPENMEYVTAFKAAPKKYLRYVAADGITRWRQLLPAPGATRVFQKEGAFRVVFAAKLGHEYKTIR